MKNIWKIFRRDLQQIQKNVIAMIVIIGITVVPCLYAWFNIAASWDPYENTGNLKVAVASVDEGYEGSIIPIKLTLGDQVLSALRENTQLEWVFTTKSKAMKGVKSGKYYAAIVIPEDFSRNMMSVFTSDIRKPEITYYSNAKENAIAPKVTDKGATAIQTQVNEVFIETISDTVFTALQTVSNTADRQGSGELVSNLINNLKKINTDLTTASSTLQSFSGMTSSAQQLLDTTASFLQQTQKQTTSNVDALKETQKSFSGLQQTVSGATDSINAALTASKGFYDQMSDVIDSALQTQSSDASAVSDTRRTICFCGTASFSMPNAISLSVSTLKDCVRGFWNTLPTFSAIRYIGNSVRFSPSSKILPFNLPAKNCGIKPLISRVNVVFPHPLRPQSRTHCPSGTVRSICFKQPSMPPGYVKDTSWNSIIRTPPSTQTP